MSEDFVILEQERLYLQSSMNGVSRSFAIVVPNLEPPLDDYFATAYLICRVVDNIEDCTHPFYWQQQRFSEFHQLLSHPESAREILAVWDQESWPGLTIEEVAMMGTQYGAPLWKIYAAIPESERASIAKWAGTMADGMCRVEDPDLVPRLIDHDGVSMLADAEDYNGYCYYVAGTVGQMATELAISHYQFPDDVATLLFDNAEACGRSLQKTNIVKDFVKDLERGVSYLPDQWLRQTGYSPLRLAGAPVAWKYQVLDDVMQELRDATRYLVSLPYSASGYRMAALLCLLPAYQTLLLAAKRQDKLFTEKHQIKISRTTMAKCKWDAKSMIADNEAVRRYSQRMETAVAAAFGAAVPAPGRL
ncbi:MAG: squalene/phytoene synthase family protein [Chloroflexota bacterium]|nr:squalene/phytoene synthase family protein [Chloroflexota bacterium]